MIKCVITNENINNIKAFIKEKYNEEPSLENKPFILFSFNGFKLFEAKDYVKFYELDAMVLDKVSSIKRAFSEFENDIVKGVFYYKYTHKERELCDVVFGYDSTIHIESSKIASKFNLEAIKHIERSCFVKFDDEITFPNNVVLIDLYGKEQCYACEVTYTNNNKIFRKINSSEELFEVARG